MAAHRPRRALQRAPPPPSLSLAVCPPPSPTHPSLRSFPGFRYPVQPQQLALHRRRMGECLGWDHERQAQVDPINMVVIDRHYTSCEQAFGLLTALCGTAAACAVAAWRLCWLLPVGGVWMGPGGMQGPELARAALWARQRPVQWNGQSQGVHPLAPHCTVLGFHYGRPLRCVLHSTAHPQHWPNHGAAQGAVWQHRQDLAALHGGAHRENMFWPLRCGLRLCIRCTCSRTVEFALSALRPHLNYLPSSCTPASCRV